MPISTFSFHGKLLKKTTACWHPAALPPTLEGSVIKGGYFKPEAVWCLHQVAAVNTKNFTSRLRAELLLKLHRRCCKVSPSKIHFKVSVTIYSTVGLSVSVLQIAVKPLSAHPVFLHFVTASLNHHCKTMWEEFIPFKTPPAVINHSECS